MKKNNFKFQFLIALLFVANPGLIFAEELVPEGPAVPTTETVITTNETATSIVSASSTTEISQNFSVSNFSAENSSDIEVATNTISVNLNIRYQDHLVFSGPITLTKDATTTVLDNTNTNREIISSTALGALNQADIESSDFIISNLAHYDDFFGSKNVFLLNCLNISLPTKSSPMDACYNWNYVVNGKIPNFASDKYNLKEGDSIYFYFGIPRIIELSTSTIFVGDSFMATAKSYDYQNNVYVPAVNYTIGVTQPDPIDLYTPIVLFSTTSNQLGQANFTIDTTGTYIIGLETDGYFHYPEYKVLVMDINSSTTSTATTTATTTNPTSGGDSSEAKTLDIFKKAFGFLHEKQNSNGSFSDEMLTDWAAIAFSASENSSDKTLIKNYLISRNFSASSLTDYERHAMALMSLGINPYTGTKINYISKILEKFNGEYFGEGAINENIFAIFPLINAGYNSNDPEISKTVAYIISQQTTSGDSSGSWVDVDITAAAIQALVLVQDLPNVNSALEKAKVYLKKHQKEDAGFDRGDYLNSNVSSTSWVLQALVALGENQANWIKNGKTIENYLASKQGVEGGLVDVGIDSIWATSYLIPAYYGKSWDALMSNFKKPKTEIKSSNSSSSETKSSDSNIVSDDEIILENSDETTNEVEENNNAMENDPTLPALKKFPTNPETAIKEKNPPNQENNLQANALGGVSESGLLEMMSTFVDTTLAGLSTMLGFIVSLFNF